MTERSPYQSSGVDTGAGDRAVELMKAAVQASHSPRVIGGVGGFAGLYDASFMTSYRKPILATSTDGVGTKVAIAQAMDVHDTIGYDLVGMVVDDIVVVGATPLFMTDYIACGSVVPERIAAIVRGIAGACAETGVSLVGGETAEHPGLLGVDDYDVAGAATGVVEADEMLDPSKVRDGDVVLALASSGLHSNGFSLVRRLAADKGWKLDRPALFDQEVILIDALMAPTRIYVKSLLPLVRAGQIHGMAHITGGGLLENIPRILPECLHAHVNADLWEQPRLMAFLQAQGHIEPEEMARTFNCGVGMAIVVAADTVDHITASLEQAGETVVKMGHIASGQTGCTVTGSAGIWSARSDWCATHYG